jgi:hypothetical protein
VSFSRALSAPFVSYLFSNSSPHDPILLIAH